MTDHYLFIPLAIQSFTSLRAVLFALLLGTFVRPRGVLGFPATEHGNDIHDLWVTPADLTLAKCPEVLARLTPTTTPVLRDVSAEDEAERNCRKRRRGLEGPFVRYLSLIHI